MAMIDIQRLTKTYKQRTALAGVDLRIEAGEVVGLIGTNGAGRTTLLNIVATLVRATAGCVEVAGHDVLRHPLEVRRCMGYVAESSAFPAGLQVREYLDFVAASHDLRASRKAKAIDATLRRFDLDPACPIGTLSQGCQQQLALAAALLHEPMVLLLDEPVTHLDPLACQRAYTLLRELRDKGTTMLLACNTAIALQMLCNRVGFLHHGRLLEVQHTRGQECDLTAVLQRLSQQSATGDPGPSPLTGTVA